MKRMGILSLACAAALSVACAGEPNESIIQDRDTQTDDNASAVGTSGQLESRTATGPQSAQQFVNDMLAGGAAEVQLGKMAAERASSQEVKEFARQMVEDHSKAGDQLEQLASKHNINASGALTAEHRATIDRLSSLKGEQFDRAYMAEMVKKHQDTVNKLEARAEDRNRQTSARPQGSTATTGREGAAQPQAGRTDPGRAGADRPAATAGQGSQGLDMAVNQWAAQALPTVEGHLEEAQQIQKKLGGGATPSQPSSSGRGTGNR